MKILFNPDDGKIHKVALERDWSEVLYKIEKGRYWLLKADGSLNGDAQPGCLLFKIEEDEPEIGLSDEENTLRVKRKLTRHHLWHKLDAVDDVDDRKYSMHNDAGVWKLKKKSNWKEKEDGIP